MSQVKQWFFHGPDGERSLLRTILAFWCWWRVWAIGVLAATPLYIAGVVNVLVGQGAAVTALYAASLFAGIKIGDIDMRGDDSP